MSNIKARTLIGGHGDHGRNDMDFYETPKEATIALLNEIKSELTYPDLRQTRVLEPCCGEGAIALVLKEYGYFVEAHDIRFTEYAGRGIDYFSESFKADAIITNPPFSLAEEFILKALDEAPLVAMLFKATFWHTKKRLKLYYRTQPSMILPLTWRPNMSPERGKSPTMDFLWTVWIRGNRNGCTYKPLNKPTTIKELIK